MNWPTKSYYAITSYHKWTYERKPYRSKGQPVQIAKHIMESRGHTGSEAYANCPAEHIGVEDLVWSTPEQDRPG